MSIFNNAFYILNANLQDNRQRLKELFDKQNLTIDETSLYDSYNKLTNSYKRLSEELNYIFINYSPEQIKAFVNFFVAIPNLDNFFSLSEEFDYLTKINLALEIIINLNFDEDILTLWILELGNILENIDSDEIEELVNDNRELSGFSEISAEIIIKELKNYKLNCQKTLQNKLKIFSETQRLNLITKILQQGIESYGDDLPYFISNLIDFYELESQKSLNLKRQKIEENLELLKNSLFFRKKNCKDILNTLLAELKDWGDLIKPIKILYIYQSRIYDLDESMFELVFEDDVITHFAENNEQQLFLEYCENLAELFEDNEEIIEQLNEQKSLSSLWYFS